MNELWVWYGLKSRDEKYRNQRIIKGKNVPLSCTINSALDQISKINILCKRILIVVLNIQQSRHIR